MLNVASSDPIAACCTYTLCLAPCRHECTSLGNRDNPGLFSDLERSPLPSQRTTREAELRLVKVGSRESAASVDDGEDS